MTWPSPEAAVLLAKLTAGIDEVLPQALLLRRALHQHPDLGGAEQPTADRLRRAMPELAPTRIAGTGFLVRTGPDGGPSVGLRAELDALPVVEQTGVDWAASNGAMHACGHDVHLAAAWALQRAASRLDLPAGLVSIFQPREEIQPSGGEDVVASGVLADHDVRAMIGVHVQPRVPAGVVSTGTGGVNAAADEFD
ncbi:MAG: M20/M25/M40 family metallo-hydrolase, partial [Propionicimonas sp.]|nr:M20/M25/M40 family metallo-hydrolase [Propionicimonas sp.]